MTTVIIRYLNNVDHYTFFGISALTYYASFHVIDKSLTKISSLTKYYTYNRLHEMIHDYSDYDEGRRMYILANIMKSITISFVGFIFCSTIQNIP